jgi:hypothetical protein
MAHQTDAMRGDGIEKTSTTKPGQWQNDGTRHAVNVTTAQEYRDAVRAADTLDLELIACFVRGIWTTHESVDVGINSGASVSVETAGRKWFHLMFDDGQVIRARPRYERRTHAHAGELQLLFD